MKKLTSVYRLFYTRKLYQMVYLKFLSLDSYKVSPKVDIVTACILPLGKLYPWEAVGGLNTLSYIDCEVVSTSETTVSNSRNSQNFRKGKHNNISYSKLSST